MKGSGTDTQSDREELHRYFLLVPCLMPSCFLGVWATFALASLLFPENIMRTCRTDISDNTRSGLLQHKWVGQWSPWHHAKLTLPWQHTIRQIVWDLCRDHHDNTASWHYHHDTSQECFNTAAVVSLRTARQVEIVTTHPAKNRHLSIHNEQMTSTLHRDTSKTAWSQATCSDINVRLLQTHPFAILLTIVKCTRQDTMGDNSDKTPP